MTSVQTSVKVLKSRVYKNNELVRGEGGLLAFELTKQSLDEKSCIKIILVL